MSQSQASAPVFAGAQGAADTPSSAADGPSNSFNHLWLLFLIPIVLIMLALIALTWFVVRRRRRGRQRRSTLRNVTLVVAEEEEKREREERRLTRGSSIASKMGRTGSLHEAREKRFSARVAHAVEGEKKEMLQSGMHPDSSDEKQGEAASPQSPTGQKHPTFVSRRASIKHRDREVAERVWKTSAGQNKGSHAELAASLATAAALGEANEGASDRKGKKRSSTRRQRSRRSALGRHSKPEPDLEAGKSGVTASEEEQDIDDERESGTDGEGNSVGQSDTRPSHIRASRARGDAQPLSIIGESGTSEADQSASASRPTRETDGVAGHSTPRGQSAQIDAEPGHDADSKVDAPATAAISASTIGATASSVPERRSSRSITPSQQSQTASASRPSNLSSLPTGGTLSSMDDDASMQTAPSGRLSMSSNELEASTPTKGRATPSAGTLMQSDSQPAETDPFSSPISPSGTDDGTMVHSSSRENPFASPTQSSAGHEASKTSPTDSIRMVLTTPPSAARANQTDRAASAPMSRDDSSKSTSSPGASGLARKISQVVRLKTPVPPSRKDRSRSPTPLSGSGLRRHASTSSSRAGDASTPPRPGAQPARSSQSPPAAGQSWAYTSHADEWKRNVVRSSSSSSVPTLKTVNGIAGTASAAPTLPPVSSRPSSAKDSLAGTSDAHELSRRKSLSSGVPSRRWIDPAPVVPGSVPKDSTLAGRQQQALQRKGSIGVAGSRFKETFDD
ncbi:unnamed protein product [Jaminaea pallidilutea]